MPGMTYAPSFPIEQDILRNFINGLDPHSHFFDNLRRVLCPC